MHSLKRVLTPRTNEYIAHFEPTLKQMAFLVLDDVLDVFFGGAAGGGKSVALLYSALQYVDLPGYSAILFRASYSDLSLPGAIMDVSQEWLRGTDAKWNDHTKTWTFPSGSQLVFGYLDKPNDHLRYKGAEFQYIGVDEASDLRWTQIQYMFSRLRRSSRNLHIPLRFRSASNPGGRSHEQLKRHYVDPKTRSPGAVFIPAGMKDNPHLDKESYELALAHLDPITRRQLRDGNWDVKSLGNMFQSEWFTIAEAAPADARRIRWWDIGGGAASVARKSENEDWTVGARLAYKDGLLWIEDIKRFQSTPRGVENMIRRTAEQDGRGISVYMEQEPGSSGAHLVDHYRREVLQGFAFYAERSSGDKEEYAKPLSAAAEAGNVRLLNGKWIDDLLDEMDVFPYGDHDDQVDAVSKGFAVLSRRRKIGAWGRKKSNRSVELHLLENSHG